MRRILVTGAGGAAAANFVHSLRLAPEPFFAVGTDTSKFHLELAPVDERYLLPRADDPLYLDELNAAVEAEGVQLVHPQPEQEVLALARNCERVGAATFLPRAEAIALCQDNRRSPRASPSGPSRAALRPPTPWRRSRTPHGRSSRFGRRRGCALYEAPARARQPSRHLTGAGRRMGAPLGRAPRPVRLRLHGQRVPPGAGIRVPEPLG
ncbi:MAG: hypothetical protein ACRDNH_06475 [Gaiellaceae bacterium]